MTDADTPHVIFRPAIPADLPAIVAMLADDPFASTREQALGSEAAPPDPAYRHAFDEITSDPNQHLLVAVPASDPEAPPVGVLQLSYIPSLTYRGGRRAQIEGVRVHPDWRSHGVGAALFHHAIECARAADCVLVQLTTDRRREDALRFYERLGFVASHWGMKLHLTAR